MTSLAPQPARCSALFAMLSVAAALSVMQGRLGAAPADSYGHLEVLAMNRPALAQASENIAFGRGPEALEAQEPFVRFLKSEAYVDFELACDPQQQNYFTVKVWGGSGAEAERPGSTLLLRDPDTGDAPFGHVPHGPVPRHHPRRGEISRQHMAPPFPGRFFYVTYPIPRAMTDGNSSVQLRLLYKGPEPGLDVYNVYTHLGSFFDPPADELQGEPFALGPPRGPEAEQASAEERYEHWRSEANRGVRRALEMQLYGEQWDEHIEKGKVPEWARGAFLARGGGFPTGPYAELEGEIHRWGSWLIRQADSGLPSFRYLEVFARAYREEWSEFYQDAEMLERIVSALDFYVRAQGGGGGWQGPALEGRDVNWPTWLGGPERSDFMPGLETGQRHLYEALRMIYDDLEAAELLEVLIDHDLNPETPEISRRKAYAEMAERSFGLYEEQVYARPIANQVIHNYVPLYQVWKTIQRVEPQRAASEERMLELAEIATGLRRHPRWKSYMYSPRGMPMEFGYDANYGNGGMQLVDLAKLTGFPALEERAREVYEAYAHFVFLDNDSDGHRTLRNTDWISWRVFRGFPGRIRYFLSEYAARELQIPAAIRYYELYQEHQPGRPAGIPIHDRDTSLQDYMDLARLNFGHRPGLWHRIINAINWVSIAGEEKEGRGAWHLDLPATDYRLPDEREEDSAFVDEHLGLVALRHGDARLFASLNWKSRGGRDWVDGRANNIVRLQYTTPVIDRLVTATSMDTPGGPLELSTMRYGPYFVVMNGSEEKSFEYEVPDDMRGAMATDLLTGEKGELKDGTIGPSSSRVFATDSKAVSDKSGDAFSTYCNPLNINYTMTERGRHAADPEIVLFNDKYYLFTTWDIEGYRVSDDLVNWKDVLFSEDTWAKISADIISAPAVATDGDYVYFINGVTREGKPVNIFRTQDPESGVWEVCGSMRRVGDPALFIDKGRFFVYHGLCANDPTQVFELDPETFTEIPDSNKILRPAKSGVDDYIGSSIFPSILVATAVSLLPGQGRMAGAEQTTSQRATILAGQDNRTNRVRDRYLDHVNFGDRASERAHQFISENSEVPKLHREEGAGPRVLSVIATAGTAPEATLMEAGEWGVHREGEWIEYELSEPTEVDRVAVAWGRTQTFRFEIHTSPDGETWNLVFQGESWRRGRDHFETYRFDPVRARHVRIVALGRDTGWQRTGRFFLAQVRIGELAYPEAYEPALRYKPGLNQPCRRLLPVSDRWEGGWMRFAMKSHPAEKNYLTVKLWGSDSVMAPLYLRDEKGRWVAAPRISMRRSGDNAAWTPLWEFAGDEAGGPLGAAGGPFPGRFIYVTYPIPREMTEGKSEVILHIQAVGSRFERPMAKPSQGIYAAYTHTEPFSRFADDEPQGEAFRWGPSRPVSQETSVEDKLMADARELIAHLIEGRGLGTDDYRGLIALTQAYHAEWSDHYRDPKIPRLVRQGIDDFIRRQAAKGEGPSGLVGGGWHVHGNLAHSFAQVSDAFESMGFLEEKFEYPADGPTELPADASRRDVYARFFKEALEWRRSEAGGRRRMANQVVSVDRAIYRMNRALQLLAPELAMPEPEALRYLYESAGMEPFYSPRPRHAWVRAVAEAGYPYHVISDKGNAREVGLGTSYGEGAPSRFARLAAEIDDEAFTERVRQLAEARATMTRRPANDGAGYAVLRAPVTFGWRGRTAAYPGLIRYTNSPFIQAAVLQDPISLRLAELYLEHGRVFAEEMPRINQIIPRVEAYRTVRRLLPTDYRLPMEPDHADFAWADEDVAVFAARHGDTMISGSFFLDKAGLTPYGRIHFTTPQIERIATLKVATRMQEAEHTYTIPHQLPGGRENVLGGRQRPAAAAPPNLLAAQGTPPTSVDRIGEGGGDQWMGSDERSSMADLYQVRFGDYFVAMNTTVEGTYRERTFTLDVPPGPSEALELVSGERLDLSEPHQLGPRSTVVLYFGP